MTAKEYRFLMNNRKEMSLEDLQELLIDNEVSNFDPVAEAFKLFDPRGSGGVSTEKLREVFSRCGLGELSDEELGILMTAGDLDGDGTIGLGDFRGVMDASRRPKPDVGPGRPTSQMRSKVPAK